MQELAAATCSMSTAHTSVAAVFGRDGTKQVTFNPIAIFWLACAGMVTQPGECRWSSYGSNELGKEDKLLTPHDEYLTLDPTAASRKDAYRKLFVNEDDDSA